MILQYRNGRSIVIRNKFSISPVRNAKPVTIIPQKAVFAVGRFTITFTRIISAPATITGWPVLFQIIGGVCSHCPVVSIGTHFSIHVKVIEQNKLFGDCMKVWSCIFTEKNQSRIAVSFRNVAQNLIVSPVFFNNIKDILDG